MCSRGGAKPAHAAPVHAAWSCHCSPGTVLTGAECRNTNPCHGSSSIRLVAGYPVGGARHLFSIDEHRRDEKIEAVANSLYIVDSKRLGSARGVQSCLVSRVPYGLHLAESTGFYGRFSFSSSLRLETQVGGPRGRSSSPLRPIRTLSGLRIPPSAGRLHARCRSAASLKAVSRMSQMPSCRPATSVGP